MKNMLSLAQMKNLASLGINITDGSMLYIEYNDSPDIDIAINLYPEEISYNETPTYILQDLLNKIPHKIYIPKKDSKISREYKFEFIKGDGHYLATYSDTSNGHILFDWIINENPIDVLYEIVIWLKEHNKI